MRDNLPNHVEQDLVAGFIITDEDDGYQRCKKLTDTVFLYRCDVNDEVYEEEIDIKQIDADEAIDGYYDSVEDMVEENGQTGANMLIAECYFKNNSPMHIPE